MAERNPVIIPEGSRKGGLRCQKCGSGDYTGRMIGGVANMQCKKCGNKWQGGLPQLPQDPRQPIPPEPPKAGTVQFTAERNMQGEVVSVHEQRVRPDLTQPFRRGAPIPDDEGY